jgi:spermidine synthase
MLNPAEWFTEIDTQNGSAFSLKLKAKLHEEQTPYQKIEIYATEEFGNLMVIDGCIMLSSRDNFLYHEMLTHPALYSHPAPKRVWIIGGGDCGSLREVLKHPEVETAVQIEIDERVTRLSERYFPELCEANGDPRARLVFQDGIQWVREAPPASVEVIIVDSTDPIGPAAGLFTEVFYRDCLRCLSPDGILIQQSESPLFHLDLICALHRAMRGAGFKETHTLFFPQPVYPSGWWSATLACKAGLAPRWEDLRHLAFPTRYYNLATHQAAFSAPPFFRQALAEALRTG